ncbi:hypothetical protein DPMN_069535 [Dreissena polymorpha]|uniref:Uncharacterized protein n=1 Tax=Dreissena polymorpha TaxID=45954 RepID=A0A9D3Z4I6_DREPO|nr:hypothetical protein DPMN_069535 [Dreissena polymorpha]
MENVKQWKPLPVDELLKQPTKDLTGGGSPCVVVSHFPQTTRPVKGMMMIDQSY